MTVNRRTWKEPDFVLKPGERVSVESAIRAVMAEATGKLFSEHEIRSLEVWKLADLVILEHDLRKVPVDTIKNILVLETRMGKKYSRPDRESRGKLTDVDRACGQGISAALCELMRPAVGFGNPPGDGRAAQSGPP